MSNFYAVEIEYCKDRAWTYCEARHPEEAARIIRRRLGDNFEIRQVKPAKPVIIATEPKETQMTQEQRKPAKPQREPKRPRTKTVVTPDAEYPSLKEAQKHIQGGIRRLRKLFKEQPDKYYIK